MIVPWANPIAGAATNIKAASEPIRIRGPIRGLPWRRCRFLRLHTHRVGSLSALFTVSWNPSIRSGRMVGAVGPRTATLGVDRRTATLAVGRRTAVTQNTQGRDAAAQKT